MQTSYLRGITKCMFRVSKLSLLSKTTCQISTECNDWGVITKGIQQGSIYGPFIFKIFLNDIFFFDRECDIFIYADDNYIYVNHKNSKLFRDALQEESKVMVEWFNSNYVQANPCKFQGILFKGTKSLTIFESMLKAQKFNINPKLM